MTAQTPYVPTPSEIEATIEMYKKNGMPIPKKWKKYEKKGLAKGNQYKRQDWQQA